MSSRHGTPHNLLTVTSPLSQPFSFFSEMVYPGVSSGISLYEQTNLKPNKTRIQSLTIIIMSSLLRQARRSRWFMSSPNERYKIAILNIQLKEEYRSTPAKFYYRCCTSPESGHYGSLYSVVGFPLIYFN